jgi:hypothetical protein
MRKALRIAIPILLVGLGIYLLVGCIPIPGNFQRRHVARPEEHIGKPGSGKPLIIGRDKYGFATEFLGQALLDSDDKRAAVYSYSVNDFSMISPLCFYVSPQYHPRYLLLRFDDSGVLKSFKVYTHLDRIYDDTHGIVLKQATVKAH